MARTGQLSHGLQNTKHEHIRKQERSTFGQASQERLQHTGNMFA